MSTAPARRSTLIPLLKDVRACTLCAAPLAELDLVPRPVLQVDAGARILIAGQAPVRKVFESGVPFDDAHIHGERGGPHKLGQRARRCCFRL